ncbi:LPS assembly protein LptD, partial [Methylophilaceae bacterium]|nr:LPS assembly protein LptD [Methylophilaceae bacterium]
NTLRGTASLLFLEGESKKRLQNASITTCEAGQNDWFINASELEINERSQRVDAKNAELEFKGFPLLFSPYVNFSFNDDRKSGFLVPSVGSTSRSGFETAIPYYFNLSPTSDATITPRYLGKRGTQVSGEYRYLNKKFVGETLLEYLPTDDASSQDNRYYAKIKHAHELGAGFTAGYNIEKVSDDNYFSDMSSLISVTSQVNLSQEAFLNYSDNDWNASLVTQKFQNLTSSSPYERLPSLTVNHGKIFEDAEGFTSYETQVNFSLTQFERNNDYVGASNENGTRLTAKPSLSIPFERPYGYVTPKLAMDIKYYDLNDANVASKDFYIPTVSLDSGLYLDKKMSFKDSTFTQTLEPRIFYSYTSYEDQSMLPMFDTALVDLNAQSIFSENQFVGGDRVMDSHQVTLGGTTRFIDAYGIERISGTIAQRFYIGDRTVLNESQFNNSSAQNDSSDLFMSASALITRALKLNADAQYNLDENSTNRATFGAKYNPRPGKLLNASYRLINNPASSASDVKQINIAGQWPLGSGWSSVARYNYDIKSSSLIESLAGFEFDAGCWSASVLLHSLALGTAEKRNDTLFFQLELGGLGSLGTGSQGSLAEVLNRNVPGSYGLNQLPESYRNENQD